MSKTLIERYRRWFDYEKDSHARTIASLQAVPSELRDGEAFPKAVYLMGHIIAARRMWLFRLGITEQNAELFPQDVTLAQVTAKISEMETLWSEYLLRIDDAELDRVVE